MSDPRPEGFASGAPVDREPAIDLQEILRHTRDAITVQAPDGRLLFANRAAAELLGFPDEASMLAAPATSILAGYELIDERGGPLSIEDLPGRRAMRGEETPEAVVRFRDRKGGPDRWSLVRSTPVMADGALHYVINAFQDVTELKRREIHLRVLADAADVLGASADYEETLRELAHAVVPELADWCVVDVFEEGRMNRVVVAHPDPDRLRKAEELQRRYPPDPDQPGAPATVAKTGKPLLVAEVTEEMLVEAARDEEHLARLRELDMRSAIVLPLSARGVILGAMTLVRGSFARPYSDADLPLLTELARRAALAVDNARLMHDTTLALRLRDEFLATLSHDMRTPLATVLGYVQISRRQLDRMEGAERLGEYLERAERTTIRMAHLVSELMDVSLISAGQPIPLLVEAVDVNQLIERSMNEQRQLDGTHELVFERSDGPAVAMSDPSRIERIVDNLLSNAFKFSPEGSTVRVRVVAAPDAIMVSVTDKGVGIPADELPLIFERFHRASTARGAPGFGLGLAGSREVARRMGGDLVGESAVGSGSTFTLRIPATPPEETAPSVEEPGASA